MSLVELRGKSERDIAKTKIFLNGGLPLLNRSRERRGGKCAEWAQIQISGVTPPVRSCKDVCCIAYRYFLAGCKIGKYTHVGIFVGLI